MPTLQETHLGLVTSIDDPDKRGRIKCKCQTLIGADYELPDWLPPLNALLTSTSGAGSLFLPAVGSTVELVVDEHDTKDDTRGERLLQNPAIKWRAATPTDSAGPMPVPTALKTNYPHRRGLQTPAGHQLIFDDKSGSVIIRTKDGAQIEMKSNGEIVLAASVIAGDGATELMVLGNALMALYNAHTHVSAAPASPTGPPIVLMSTAQLSQGGNKVK